MQNRKTLSFFSVVSFLFYSVCLAANAASFDPALQRELTIISSPHAYDLNPHTATYADESQVLTGLYEGLFSYNPYSLEPELALVESFKVSRNKKTWTFTLRKNAHFSNGEVITAEHVKKSWLALLEPGLQAPFASLLDCIAGVADYRNGKAKKPDAIGIEVKDERTLVVKLINPTEHLSRILCHHAFAVVHPDKNVYSGAFVLESFSPETIVLKKNPVYWDSGSVALPYVRFILSDNSQSNTFDFNVGNVQWVDGAIDSGKVLLRNSIMLSSQFGTEYLFFKCGKKPYSDERVRNALLYAIPNDEIRKNSFIKANSLVLPLSGYPEVLGAPELDLDEAASLLKTAGYGKGRKLTINICFSNDDTSKRRAELLAKAWQPLGIEVNASFLEVDQYLASVEKGDADFYSYSWIGDFADPLAFLELFRGSSSLNVTGWKNQKYDAILSEASAMSNNEQRFAKLAEAEQMLLDSGVIYPICHTVSFNVIDNEVIGGWYDNALNIHPLKYIKFIQPALPANIVMAN